MHVKVTAALACQYFNRCNVWKAYYFRMEGLKRHFSQFFSTTQATLIQIWIGTQHWWCILHHNLKLALILVLKRRSSSFKGYLGLHITFNLPAAELIRFIFRGRRTITQATLTQGVWVIYWFLSEIEELVVTLLLFITWCFNISLSFFLLPCSVCYL